MKLVHCSVWLLLKNGELAKNGNMPDAQTGQL